MRSLFLLKHAMRHCVAADGDALTLVIDKTYLHVELAWDSMVSLVDLIAHSGYIRS